MVKTFNLKIFKKFLYAELSVKKKKRNSIFAYNIFIEKNVIDLKNSIILKISYEYAKNAGKLHDYENLKNKLTSFIIPL